MNKSIYFIRNKIVAEFNDQLIPRVGDQIILSTIDASLFVKYLIWEPEFLKVQIHLDDGKGF
jgi:hypothetical protein